LYDSRNLHPALVEKMVVDGFDQGETATREGQDFLTVSAIRGEERENVWSMDGAPKAEKVGTGGSGGAFVPALGS